MLRYESSETRPHPSKENRGFSANHPHIFVGLHDLQQAQAQCLHNAQLLAKQSQIRQPLSNGADMHIVILWLQCLVCKKQHLRHVHQLRRCTVWDMTWHTPLVKWIEIPSWYEQAVADDSWIPLDLCRLDGFPAFVQARTAGVVPAALLLLVRRIVEDKASQRLHMAAVKPLAYIRQGVSGARILYQGCCACNVAIPTSAPCLTYQSVSQLSAECKLQV